MSFHRERVMEMGAVGSNGRGERERERIELEWGREGEKKRKAEFIGFALLTLHPDSVCLSPRVV